MSRESCGACGARDLDVFVDLGKTPLANTFPASPDEPEQFWPLQVGRCPACGLVQQMEVVPDELIYGDAYGFYSGGSYAQRVYHEQAAHLLMGRYPWACERGVLEIACNDGALLWHFARNGHRVLGVDPAAPAQAAIDDGLPVLRESFTAALGSRLRAERGPFGLVIAYNSLAHVADLSDVLLGMWAVMDERSVAVVEVQYLPDLLVGNLIGQIYHEHRYFHSLTSFQRAAGLHGLAVADAELIELQGGGLRVTLVRREQEPSARAEAILASERWLTDPATFAGVQGRVERNRDHLRQLVLAERDAGRVVGGYAAAAKATTILNFCGLGPDLVEYVIDTTPYKHGRYIPGVRTPIVAPGSPEADLIDTRLLLTSNYLGHVLRADRAFLDRGGRWLVAEPVPMVV
jgi:methylation protein EvaC